MPVAVRERLKSVKSLVPHGTRLLDVGSDHAALPISLFSGNMITGAVISDINEKPLQRAKNEAAKTVFFDKCTFVLSDGFDRIDPDSFDVAAICGMGGTLISSMIERGISDGRLKKEHVLIVQPMTDIYVVRKCLWDNGYRITDEIFSVEGKYDSDPAKNRARPYGVIKAEYSGIKCGYSVSDLFFGKIRGDDTAFLCFKEKTMRMLSNKLKGILISLKAERQDKKRKYYADAGLKKLCALRKKPFKDHLRKKLLK